MGYDEPTAKHQAASPDATRPAAGASSRAGRWTARLLLMALAIGGGGYLAANPAAFDKVAGLADSVFSPAQAPGRGGRGAPPPPPVRVALAETRDVPMEARTIGTVLANSVVVVKSQIDGPLMSVAFREGQMVKKGDLLFSIDPAPFAAAVRQAEANVARDQAQRESAEADAARAVMLAERGIVSAQQRDQLVANAKALAASVAADEAALDRARLNLGYTTIRSPIDGKTGPYTVNPGNQVHANDQIGLITITQIQPVKIAFNLPQSDLPQLQDRLRENALTATVALRGDLASPSAEVRSEGNIPMKVDFIGSVVDARTGTVELRATFDNPDMRLVPGELVDVGVRLQLLAGAVTVPHEAVNVGQDGEYVFVVDANSKAQARPIKVLYQDRLMAALGAGVEAGERVVIDGQLRLTPGVAVRILPAPGAAEPRAPEATLRPSAAVPVATAVLPSAEGPEAEGTTSKTASPQAASTAARGRNGG